MKVVCLTLHGENDISTGPTFSYSTIKQDKGLSFICGVTFLDMKSIVGLRLTYDSSTSMFRGTFDIKHELIPDGSAKIVVELSQREGKYDLRFGNLPLGFKDIIDAKNLAEAVDKLSRADGICGAITLLFK